MVKSFLIQPNRSKIFHPPFPVTVSNALMWSTKNMKNILVLLPILLLYLAQDNYHVNDASLSHTS